MEMAQSLLPGLCGRVLVDDFHGVPSFFEQLSQSILCEMLWRYDGEISHTGSGGKGRQQQGAGLWDEGQSA